MEDSNAMTIEFLRARLLSERSVSRTARQRADELAARVFELEEQLKIVSLQRVRAEKATADVLAILESNGATDISETYDSSSDQEATPCSSEVGHSSSKDEETLTNGKFSGRSLSWKSGKDSSHSLDRKLINSSRRMRSSFVSSASSQKHIGKSCRQIRRRSAANEMHNDMSSLHLNGDEVAECAGVPTCSDLGPLKLKERPANHEEQLVESPLSEDLGKHIVTDCHCYRGHGGDKDMKKALEHQAELIGRYEAEEKAQRDWEEKFRENNSHTPDSCDLGFQSDITEERDDSREPSKPLSAKKLDSPKQEMNLRGAGVSSSNESTTHGSQSAPQFDVGHLHDQKSGSSIAHKLLATSEFEISMATSSHDQEHVASHHNLPVVHHSEHVSSSDGSTFHNGASEITHEFALMPHEPSNKLVYVLEELQKAKLSLKQNLNRSQLIESGYGKNVTDPSVPLLRSGDGFEFPVRSAALFLLPTDFLFDTAPQVNLLSSGPQLSLTNYNHRPVAEGFFPSHHIETRSSTSGDQYSTPQTYPYMNATSRHHIKFPPTFQTTLGSGVTTSTPHSYLSSNLMSSSNYARPVYPFYPDIMPRVPLSEGMSRSLMGTEAGSPPPAHFQFHDDQFRPRMYR